MFLSPCFLCYDVLYTKLNRDKLSFLNVFMSDILSKQKAKLTNTITILQIFLISQVVAFSSDVQWFINNDTATQKSVYI